MRFVSLALEHFLSFRKRQEIPLADLGLVQVRGENRLSQAMDSNGAGKSALWSALSWCDFGETLPMRDGKVFRAGEVACRFTEERCVVEHVLAVDGRERVITRCQRPFELLLDGRKAEQAEVTQLLGYGPALFRNAIVFGQETFERFARADQGSAMKMLDEIQGVSFKEALDRAKAWRDEWQRRIFDLTREASRLETQRTSAERQIVELEAAYKSFAADKAARIAAAEARARAAQRRFDDAAARLAALLGKASAAKRLREKWERVRAVKAEYEALHAAQVEADRQVGLALAKIEELGEQVEALVHDGVCPTCRGDVSDAGVVRRRFSPDLKRAQARRAQAEVAAAAACKAERAKAAELERHLKSLPGVTEQTVAAMEAEAGEAAVRRAEAEKSQAGMDLAAAKQAVETERGARWDGQAALAAVHKERTDAERALAVNVKDQAKATATVRAAEYWVEAFGDRGLRSLLFDSVAGFLNERVAHHLAILAAGEAEVEISALRPLKGGAVKEQLTTAVRWAWGAGVYGGSSAGQGSRVDLAQFAALQDLAERRSARPFPLKIFDEPECHVDARGKEILAGWIMREARQRGTAFVTTHDSDLLGALTTDGEWVVILDKDGSRVEVG